MALGWTVHDLVTGDLIDELPLTVGSIEKTIGEASTISVSLPVHSDKCPENWADLIDPMRVMFVLSDGDHPIQGYYISEENAGEPTATFPLTSLEGIPGETYCRTYDFTEGVHDESTVVATLLSDYVAAPLSKLGSFGFELAVTPTGISRDHSYLFEEDRTVGDAISELSKARGGPEWTVRLRWESDAKQRIIKTILVGPKVGATIESVVVENIHLKGDRIRRGAYSRGNRAVHVIATGDGSGAGRMMSAEHRDLDALESGVPQWEVRLNTSGVEDDAQLDAIGAAGLTRRRRGVRTWEMRLDLSTAAPRPGRDFNAGDTITIDSDPTDNDPAEWHGLARAIGWRADVVGDELASADIVFYEEPEEFVS